MFNNPKHQLKIKKEVVALDPIYDLTGLIENMMIQKNPIHQGHANNVKTILFLGSTCLCPGNAPKSIKEDSLLNDTLEYINEPYTIAKIAGIKV